MFFTASVMFLIGTTKTEKLSRIPLYQFKPQTYDLYLPNGLPTFLTACSNYPSLQCFHSRDNTSKAVCYMGESEALNTVFT